MTGHSLEGLPRVDRVLAHPRVEAMEATSGAARLKALVRAVIDEARTDLRNGKRSAAPSEAEVALEVVSRAQALRDRSTRRVINATGVVLHTNLGRAPLGDEARRAVAEAAEGYGSLEIDLVTGKRGRRAAFAEDALASLTGSEAALVVNNCAAAVLLALASSAAPGSVVVSRGELVEIGGGFRIPEILAASGARLVEVGTTNRTHMDDYARALDEHGDVRAILRVHQGNFRMTGFVERPGLRELAALARTRSLPLIEDLGGGALVDLRAFGLDGEPTVAASVAAGCELVCFSGDKVLGGPQAGVLVGTHDSIARARKHPLARALRLGRLPLAALEATLAVFVAGRAATLPAMAMLASKPAAIEVRARGWVSGLASEGLAVELTETRAEVGGGALAGASIPSFGIALRSQAGADALAARLRQSTPAVVGRVVDGAVVLDALTVLEGEDEALLDAVHAALRADLGG